MAEAVEHSLQHLPDADLKALATYLQDVPAQAGGKVQSKARDGFGAAAGDEMAQRGLPSGGDEGWRIFSGSCANCHQANGQGTAAYPSLFNNTVTGAGRPDNLISAILFGVDRTAGGQAAFMPAFGGTAAFTDRLSDGEIVAVGNYVLTRFGNAQLHVTAADVARIRAGGTPPLLAQLRPYIAPTLVAAAAVVLALLAAFLVLRGRRRMKEA